MLNLPTDNLYKFLAIFGLVITLFSVYFPFQKAHESDMLTYEHEKEVELIEHEQDFLSGRIEEIHKLNNSIDLEIEDMRKNTINEPDLEKREAYKEILESHSENIHSELRKSKVILENLKKDSFEIQKRSLELRSEALKKLEIDKVVRFYKTAGYIGLIIGFISMVTGFTLWQVKVQNPLDKQLAQAVREVEQKESSNPDPA